MLMTTLTNSASHRAGTRSHWDIAVLRTRYYDPTVGRFTSFDEFDGGNREDPGHSHKYLYAGADPVNNDDPSGQDFSVTGLLSTTGIQNILRTGIGYFNTAYRVYNFASKLLHIVEYAQLALRFLRALHAATPEGAAAAVANEIRNLVGNVSAQSIIQGFREALSTIGPHWKKISQAILLRSERIAGELALRVLPRIPEYVALHEAGLLRLVFFVPTGPGGRVADRLISIGDAVIAVSPFGGRLFGFGLTTPDRARRRDYDQLFRIDYWDGEARPPLRVHYHLIGDQAREGHDPDRTIWQL